MTVWKKFILDCSSIAGRYNNGRIFIRHDKGNLEVEYTYWRRVYIGKIQPSCDGYITFYYNSQKEFEFNEKTKEIVWSGPDAEDKWIEGCFC